MPTACFTVNSKHTESHIYRLVLADYTSAADLFHQNCFLHSCFFLNSDLLKISKSIAQLHRNTRPKSFIDRPAILCNTPEPPIFQKCRPCFELPDQHNGRLPLPLAANAYCNQPRKGLQGTAGVPSKQSRLANLVCVVPPRPSVIGFEGDCVG